MPESSSEITSPNRRRFINQRGSFESQLQGTESLNQKRLESDRLHKDIPNSFATCRPSSTKPEKALSRFKLIYIVREPIARMVSHFQEHFSQDQRGHGKLGFHPEVNRIVATLVDDSIIWLSTQPLFEHFDERQLLVLRLEDLPILCRLSRQDLRFSFRRTPPTGHV